MPTPRVIDWRKEPPGSAFEMTSEDEPIAWTTASDNYNGDKRTLANLIECEYTEVRMETIWMAWDPEEQERQWREDHCECETPHSDDFTDCTTTKPAEDMWEFWDESGYYCPWVPVGKDHPDAVKWRRGEAALG